LVEIEIIEACKQRDPKAFRKLYEACIPYVYKVVEGYVEDPDFRQDLIQEIFAKVFLRIDQFDEERGAFKYWLRQVAVNECLMYIRSKKRDLNATSIDLTPSENHPSTTQDISRLDPDWTQVVLQRMPEGYRQVFSLVEIDGYSHQEAGLRLGISPETSRSQLSRAKKWLQSNN
jgi:RNA polymerase sigma-70 factor (ECF subfamily)